jgi:predicted transcriptional regulator
MERNGRKLQILRLLTDNPLSVEEIADVSEITKKSAAMCVLRYHRQGLLSEIRRSYTTTPRGLDRVAWIEDRLVGGSPTPESMNGHRNIDSMTTL